MAEVMCPMTLEDNTRASLCNTISVEGKNSSYQIASCWVFSQKSKARVCFCRLCLATKF